MIKRPHILWHNEAGTVLVIGMLSLLLLTLIGIAATTTGTLESAISGNEKTYQEAFYAAELGLVVGETVIDSFPNRTALREGVQPGSYATGTLHFNSATYQLEIKTSADPVWRPVVWKDDQPDTAKVAQDKIPAGLSRVADVPRYIIEEREFVADSAGLGHTYGRTGVYRFNISARGTGGSKAAHALLETIYAKRYE
jgi:type IV pilus assembly protein PilX